MGTSSFQAGAIVEIDKKPHQMLRMVDDKYWQLENIRTKRIQEHSILELHKLYATGTLVFASDRLVSLSQPDKSLGRKCGSLSEAEFEQAKLRRLYAMAVMDLPNTAAAFAPAISQVWHRVGKPSSMPHWTTVYRWKIKFQRAGKDVQALANNKQAQGNRSERYPEEVTEIVSNAVETCYLKQERKTIQDTLDYAIVAVRRENQLRPESMLLPLPTRRLLRRIIDAIPAFDRYAARYGRVAATKKFRSVQAHRTTAAPLERAEIDHTLLDMMVLDDKTGLPLGRPYLTACIDDYSRCLLGLKIGFEPPSYLTVAQCLKDAFLPKSGLREKYPNIRNDWDAHGVMRELVVDNGAEFHSVSLENACYSLGIEIHYSARKTPWFKGKIERFQGTLNRAVAHGNPGTTFHNIFEKEEYDPSKHAVVRLSTLKEIVHTWVVDVYHQKPHRTLNAPPAVVWKNSISIEDILLPDDPVLLNAIMGRSESRRLTHKGIELHGLFYNSHELTSLRRELGDKLDVEVRVDESDLGAITVFSPDKKRMFNVHSISPEYANGLSAWQHRVCKKFAARELGKYDSTAWLEAKMAISKLIEDEFMHKKQKTRTKIARFKGEPKQSPNESQTSLPQTFVEASPIHSVEPYAIENIVSSESPSIPGKRFKPLFRERLPSQLAEENADMVETKHD
ncbi:MAG: DDE-type integrase/transposase/recombinase [Betaproteobacteria bacterium]